MADRFHVNSALTAGLVTVRGPEAHHLAHVCRLGPGDEVILFNGNGREYPSRISEVSRKEVVLEVLGENAPTRELPYPVLVAVPLPKGDRASFLVEKLTELGVTDLVPLATARSVVHPRDAKLDRLQRQVIEASKQCGRNVLLQVHPLTRWLEFCTQSLPAEKVLAHPGEESARLPRGNGPVALAVGPEGGFTDEEVARARTAGWRTVGLGPRILRVETAALALAVLASPPSG